MSVDQKLCLVIIAGIPGSGKTYFTKELHRKLVEENHQCVLVSYDEIFPVVKQRQLVAQKEEWMKPLREDVLSYVESLVSESSFVQQSKLELSFPEAYRVRPSFVVLDDNFYYRSMRYEFYQLAKKYKLGFCQFVIKCPTAVAIQQNNGRPVDHQVPKSVILEMDSKFEMPEPMKCVWEQFSFIIPVTDNCQELPFSMVVEMVKMARSSPVEEEDNSKKLETSEKDRQLCNANIVHQSDKVLRKIVGEKIKAVINSLGVVKDQIQFHTCKLNDIRLKILDDMKCGILRIDILIKAKIEGREEDAFSELESWLTTVFSAEELLV